MDVVPVLNEFKSLLKDHVERFDKHVEKFDGHTVGDETFQKDVGENIAAIKTNIEWLKWGMMTGFGAILVGFIGLIYALIEFLIKK